jgi:hypothetical protein
MPWSTFTQPLPMEFNVLAQARCRDENGLLTILVLPKEVRSTLNPRGHLKLVLILALCLGGLLQLGWFKVIAHLGRPLSSGKSSFSGPKIRRKGLFSPFTSDGYRLVWCELDPSPLSLPNLRTVGFIMCSIRRGLLT